MLAKTVEMGFVGLQQGLTQIQQDMREFNARFDRQATELRTEIRDVRTTSQRQLWVLIGVVVITVGGGVLRFVLFTTP